MRVAGKHTEDEANKFVKDQIDNCLKKGESVSKTTAQGFIPVVLETISSILGYFGVPESMRSFFKGKAIQKSEPLVDACVKSTSKVSRNALHKSTDSSISIYNRVVSWFRGN